MSRIATKKKPSALAELLAVMARLRSPTGCPWDREQDHRTLRYHAVEEVYELMDAIEAGDDHEMAEELGDLLLQVVFHCQMASERGAFDFEQVARRIVEKLIRRHPHVFGDARAKTVDAVWTQWEQIKKAEKLGTKHARSSSLDGIPKHLPALLRAEKLVKKARKAKLLAARSGGGKSKSAVARELFALAEYAQSRGWSAEELLREEAGKQERFFADGNARTAGKHRPPACMSGDSPGICLAWGRHPACRFTGHLCPVFSASGVMGGKMPPEPAGWKPAPL